MDWRDKYDHMPNSNGTFCNRCGRFCKKKTAIGYKQKEMYIVYKAVMSVNGIPYWREIERVCPGCIGKVHIDESTFIRKLADYYLPLPEIRVQQKCSIN